MIFEKSPCYIHQSIEWVGGVAKDNEVVGEENTGYIDGSRNEPTSRGIEFFSKIINEQTEKEGR